MADEFVTALREAAEASVQKNASSAESLIRQAFYDGVSWGMRHGADAAMREYASKEAARWSSKGAT